MKQDLADAVSDLATVQDTPENHDMTRTSTILLATLLLGITACDKPADDVAKTQPAADEAKPADDEAKPAADEAQPEQVAVASGLALGERFAAFDIINCESGDQYCQVCKYGPSPKIMAVGTIDDEAFKQDLKDLDAMVAKYGEDKVKAFAVIAEVKDGALVTPLGNKDELQAKAKALKAELGITMPIVIPAPKNEAPNGTFEEHYQVKQSRTIMFADSRNQVKYSEIAPSDYASLDAAIKAAIGA
jgi:hypothetical protein